MWGISVGGIGEHMIDIYLIIILLMSSRLSYILINKNDVNLNDYAQIVISSHQVWGDNMMKNGGE